MRIAFLTPWYPDERQPFLGLFIKEQAMALSKHHEVFVIVAKVDYKNFSPSKYSLIETKQEGRLKCYHLTISKSFPLINQINHLYITWRISKDVLFDKRIEIIHSFVGYPGAIWGWMVSKSLNIPFVHTEHTKLSNNYRSLWHRYLTNLGMRGAEAITTVSKWLANQLNSVTKRKIYVIPNLINIDNFRPGLTSKRTDVLQIGFLGGLNTDVKGLDILLYALAKFRADFQLHIGGDGILKDKYLRLAEQLNIEDKCKFHGAIERESIPTFYKNLHFFVCSSRHETFSIAIIEALAMGIPVLSTRCGGPEEILTSNRLGLLVEKENPEQLLNGIMLMSNTWSSFKAIELHEYIKAKYSISTIIKMYEEVYSRHRKSSDY